MRIYLAGQWDLRAKLRDVAAQLHSHGHEVLSDWHGMAHDDEDYAGLDHAAACRIAVNDIRRLESSDLVILDTHGSTSKGGRDFEAGAAVMAGIWRNQPGAVWVVGPPTNVFTHWLGAMQAGEQGGGVFRPFRMVGFPLLPFPATWDDVFAALAPPVLAHS